MIKANRKIIIEGELTEGIKAKIKNNLLESAKILREAKGEFAQGEANAYVAVVKNGIGWEEYKAIKLTSTDKEAGYKAGLYMALKMLDGEFYNEAMHGHIRFIPGRAEFETDKEYFNFLDKCNIGAYKEPWQILETNSNGE